MKTIGMVGGTSWLSTIDYYRIINQEVNKRMGGNTSAQLIMHSVNYGEIIDLTFKDDWDSIVRIVVAAAQKAEKAGADCMMLCANTMHRIAPQVQAAISIPLIHVAEATARAAQKKNVKSVLLLGTKYTVRSNFYPEELGKKNIQLVLPNASEEEWVNATIYNEMGKGLFLPATKERYKEIILQYASKGVEGVILGCTEIPILLPGDESPLPAFDTTRIHAEAAVEFVLG